MSNTLVGGVYEKIMEEVIQGCIVTFEEEGVDKRLLDEVKTSWQAKLSERNVAQMPWDPAPSLPPQANSIPNSATSNRNQQQASSQAAPQTSGLPPMQQAQIANGGVQIKQEVKQEIKQEPQQASYDLANLPQTNPDVARERAQTLVKEKLAANQQAGINAHAAAQLQGQRGVAPLPQPGNEQQRRMYQQQMQQNAMRMNQQMQRNGVGNAQTDGAGDEWQNFVTDRRVGGIEAMLQADASLKAHIEQTNRDMEGGGLMIPLSEAQKRSKTTKHAKHHLTGGVGQTDGPGDDDDAKEEDEDAINSDLDDTDDDQGEEAEDDGNSGELMVCTYDKVQRVKNKWKCTLKDGVLSTGGKEYVFHKAQGEFEW